jgi:ATP synthase F1 complex assembly factor 2
MRRRFWKDVNVKKIEEGPGAGQYQILLDTRPVRTPEKKVLTVPGTKPHLAEAIALEWDLLVSAQQALKTHLIPLTSLVARALDIAEDDSAGGQKKIRDSIMTSMMRYLSTDTLLCWAETPPAEQPGYETHASRTKSLRQIQKEVTQPIIEHLSTNLWPGVEIVPVLEDGSIMPIPQPQHTQDIIRGWMHGLPAFELAGLERAVLAGKSLMIAARLVAEWSEEMIDVQTPEGQKRFGVEEAAHAATLEVEYQLGMWGVVEDTHDVDREDVKRQFGSVVLLVSGETRP